MIHEAKISQQRQLDKTRAEEIECRMHPRTAEDFDVLHAELEAWRSLMILGPLLSPSPLNLEVLYVELAAWRFSETRFSVVVVMVLVSVSVSVSG